MIILLNCQILKILLDEQELQSERVLLLAPRRHHPLSLDLSSGGVSCLLHLICLLSILDEVYILKIKVAKLLVLLMDANDEVNELMQEHQAVLEADNLHVADIQRQSLPELGDQKAKVQTILDLICMAIENLLV